MKRDPSDLDRFDVEERLCPACDLEASALPALDFPRADYLVGGEPYRREATVRAWLLLYAQGYLASRPGARRPGNAQRIADAWWSQFLRT